MGKKGLQLSIPGDPTGGCVGQLRPGAVSVVLLRETLSLGFTAPRPSLPPRPLGARPSLHPGGLSTFCEQHPADWTAAPSHPAPKPTYGDTCEMWDRGLHLPTCADASGFGQGQPGPESRATPLLGVSRQSLWAAAMVFVHAQFFLWEETGEGLGTREGENFRLKGNHQGNMHQMCVLGQPLAHARHAHTGCT